MKPKEEILKAASDILEKEEAFVRAPTHLTFVLVEVLVDIRDILEQRLKSLDNTILKYVIPKEISQRPPYKE